MWCHFPCTNTVERDLVFYAVLGPNILLLMNCFTEILKVIAILIRNSPQCPETLEVRRAFLSDMIKLFNNSRENRR